VIVWLIDLLGLETGYYWGHTLVGSLVSIAGGSLSLILFVIVLARAKRTSARAAGATSAPTSTGTGGELQ
jgi:hypothetical protein